MTAILYDDITNSFRRGERVREKRKIQRQRKLVAEEELEEGSPRRPLILVLKSFFRET